MKKFLVLVAVLSVFAAACSSDTTIDASVDADGSTSVSGAPETTADTGSQGDSQEAQVDSGADSTESDSAESDSAEDTQSEERASGVQATDPTPVPAPTEVPAEPATPVPAADEEPEQESTTASEPSPEEIAAIQAVVDADDWCAAAQAVEDGTGAFETLNFTDPVELERGVTQSLAVISAAQRLVPGEIAADVDQTVEGFTAFATALEDANWSFIDLDLSIVESLDGPMTLASYNIDLYNFNVCGIGTNPGLPPIVLDDGTIEDDTDDGDIPGPEFEGTIRDQAVQGLVEAGFTADEANCILDDLDLTDPAAITDPAAMLEVFADCNISLDRLAQLGG